MSSLTAWNNFLKEGYEILGDDFKDLTSYGQVKDAFARLTNEVIPLLTVEPDLYAFVNGVTLKSWREKYVEKEMLPVHVAFQKDSIDILESDAMIMKDERAKYARFLHGFVVDAIQEESVQFEDMLLDEQEAQVDTGSTSEYDVEQEVTERGEVLFAELTSLREQLKEAGFSLTQVKHHLSKRFKLSPKWIDNVFTPHTKSKAHDTKEKIIREMKRVLKKMDKSHVMLNSEIDDLRKQLRSSYARYSDLYEEVSRRTGLNVGYVTAICLDKSVGLQDKKTLVKSIMEDMLKEAQGTNKKEEVAPMKPQEKTVQDRIDTFAYNLAKAVIKQLDVNDLNAEIADAFSRVTNLKTELANAESQLNTYKTVKDMLSKTELSDNDILVLTGYVDSMGK